MRLEGHTDSEPIFNAQYYDNRDLSTDRAATIAQKLQWRGVAADRIEVVGRGASQPAADNATETGRAKNRRVEVAIQWPEKRLLHFASGVDAASDEARRTLSEIAAPLLSTPALSAVVEGHADAQRPTHSHADNSTLALARAQGVVDALVALGVRPSQLSTVSYGDERPLADNATEDGRARNRRVEVEFVAPQMHALNLVTYAPAERRSIDLVQGLKTGYPTPIERTLQPRDSDVVRAAGRIEDMNDWLPPMASGLNWHLLDASPLADRWVAGYAEADTSAAGQGVVARIGSRWVWEMEAQSARPSLVQRDATLALESEGDANSWSISSPDTLRQQATIRVAERRAGQEVLTAVLRTQSGQRQLQADTLSVPVDAEPWWQWTVYEQAAGGGTRTVELTYRGLKPLPLVHLGEYWSGEVGLGGDDPSLLHSEGRVVKVWHDVAPGARLVLQYRVDGPSGELPETFVHYEVEGMWCEEPLGGAGREDGR